MAIQETLRFAILLITIFHTCLLSEVFLLYLSSFHSPPTLQKELKDAVTENSSKKHYFLREFQDITLGGN